MAKSNKEVFLGTGRRKSSIARVRLTEGKGNITVNGKKLDEYFGEETLRVIVKQPLVATNTESSWWRFFWSSWSSTPWNRKSFK